VLDGIAHAEFHDMMAGRRPTRVTWLPGLNEGRHFWRQTRPAQIFVLQPTVAAVQYRLDGGFRGVAILRDSPEKFGVAIVATDDGRFAYQVFLVCGEPRTLLTDSPRYSTPADAALAGYEAVISISETPIRRPYAQCALNDLRSG
jgi:hypothetical protein